MLETDLERITKMLKSAKCNYRLTIIDEGFRMDISGQDRVYMTFYADGKFATIGAL